MACGSRLAGENSAIVRAAARNIAIGNAARLGDDRAEPDARIDVGIVGLVDAELPTVALDRRKRAAGADHGAAFGPGIEIRGVASARSVGFDSGKITGRCTWLGHLAHDRLVRRRAAGRMCR